MNDPAGDLLQLADQLRSQRPDPDSPAGKFVAAVSAWLAGDVRSIDAALGLSAGGPGRESARRAWRRAQRDAHLRAAWDLTQGASHWERSQRLDLAIHQFERDLWPAWHSAGGPPPGASQRGTHLYAARLLGPFPQIRQLHTVCTEMRQSPRAD